MPMFSWLKKKIKSELDLNKAQTLLEKGDNESALLILKKLKEMRADFSTFLYLSIAYAGNGLLDDAEREILKAKEFEPENPFILMIEGEILLKKDKIDEAYAILKKSYTLEPFNVRTCYTLGLVEMKRNRLDDALIYFDKVVKYEKKFAEARVLLMAEMAISKMEKGGNIR